jgi:hypothetical protein
MKFALPVMFALFLQAMYGAVDLMVVGKFSVLEEVSAVSTGSQIMLTIGNLVASLAMGTTIYFGQQIGMGKLKLGGHIIGASIALFMAIGLCMSILIPVLSPQIASVMQAPEAAFAYDGSGNVKRGKAVKEGTSYSMCQFESGKMYNCDLNASYNIGARYFIRELYKETPGLMAEVPGIGSGTRRVLADLWHIDAVISQYPDISLGIVSNIGLNRLCTVSAGY